MTASDLEVGRAHNHLYRQLSQQPDFLVAGLGHTERNIVTHGNIKKLRVLKATNETCL